MKRQASANSVPDLRSAEQVGLTTVLIGMGANLGDPVASIREAAEVLRGNPGIVVRQCSSLYRTEPVGKADQDWFVNGVLHCETSMEPEQLLLVLQDVEHRSGRVRRERWGPRTLDLDILAFGELVLEREGLILPHPRLHERKFVLIPLLEILPHWRHPRLRLAGRELLQKLGGEGGQTVELLVTP
jgi:2-amino-4-hydroxy-6-hydroxymethyldihydropteridine diphosphokinase